MNNQQTGRLTPQSMLQQRYIIVGQTGKGGMGAVYQAIDSQNGQRHVAIKEMSQGALSESELIVATTRFQQEAQMLSRLNHANLPHIYNAFSEQGRSYLVMDYIDGKTLFQMLKEARDQPLPVAQVIGYALQLCAVLTYLHQQKPAIIFRDVKPTNIMVTASGQIFLIDFGIARFFKEGQEHDTEYLGSRGYAAPEQHGLAQTTPRADIYSLGATLHYCLTGQDPYRARDPFVFCPMQQVNPQVSAKLEQLVQHMVSYDDRQRPLNMAQVQQSLLSISQQATDATSALAGPADKAHTINSSQTTPAMPFAQQDKRGGGIAAQPTVAANQIRTIDPNSAQGIPTVAGRSPQQKAPFWTPGFVRLTGAALILTAGCGIGGILLFYNVAYGWTLLVASGLAVLVGLLAFSSSGLVRGILPRSIAVLTGLAALATCGALLTLSLPDIQNWLMSQFALTSSNTESWLTSSVAAVAIVSLCWLARPGSWSTRGTLLLLFGGAAICAILQGGYGERDIIKHILLFCALIALIEGLLCAVHIERIGSKKSNAGI